jgi:hypothetical protein
MFFDLSQAGELFLKELLFKPIHAKFFNEPACSLLRQRISAVYLQTFEYEFPDVLVANISSYDITDSRLTTAVSSENNGPASG